MRLALAFAALMLAAPCLADDAATDASVNALLGDPAPFRALFDTLQDAAANGDAQVIAALVAYPITVRIDGAEWTIADEEGFVADADAILVPAITDAIAGASWGTLFVNAEGLMIGDGEVWITGICSDSACAEVTPAISTIQTP